MRYIILGIVLCFCVHAELPDLGSENISSLSNSKRKAISAEVMSDFYAQRLISEDPHLNYLIQTIAQRLVKPLNISARFHVANIREPNAFALPDGQIVVYTGLISLAQTEDELASVLAHELGHVVKRHGDQMVEMGNKLIWQQIAGMALGIAVGMRAPDVGSSVLAASSALSQQTFLTFSREKEFEADETAHQIILNGGYDPHGMERMFSRFEEMRKFYGAIPTYLLTHPQDRSRIESANNWAKKYPAKPAQDTLYQFVRARLIAQNPKLALTIDLNQPPQKPWEHYRTALVLMRKAQWDQALTILKKNPSDNYLYYLAYAECLEHLQNIQVAGAYLWEHWPQNRHLPPYTFSAAEVFFYAKMYDKAALSLEASPNSGKRAALLHKTYVKLHKPLQALLAEADYWYYHHKIDKSLQILRAALNTSSDPQWNARILAKIEEMELAKKR